MRCDEEGDGDDIAASARKDVPSAKELRRSTNRDSSGEVRLRAHIQKLESMDASLLRDMDSASIGFVREFAYTGELNDSAFLKLNMMECDSALKTQSNITLNTINFFIHN